MYISAYPIFLTINYSASTKKQGNVATATTKSAERQLLASPEFKPVTQVPASPDARAMVVKLADVGRSHSEMVMPAEKRTRSSTGSNTITNAQTLLQRTAAILSTAARSIIPPRAIPRTPEDSAKEGFVRGQFKNLLLRDIFWIFFAFFAITAIEADYGRVQTVPPSTFDGQNRIFADVFRTIFELVSAYGTVGISLGTDGLPTGVSFSHALTDVSKLFVIFIMLLGRHRNMPGSSSEKLWYLISRFSNVAVMFNYRFVRSCCASLFQSP